MKKIIQVLSIISAVITATNSYAQCGPGYTQAQLNWDRVDYYYNSGGGAPYANYVTNVMEMIQKFAIGPNYVTIATSVAGIVRGENGTHNGEIAGYTGDDAQFTPIANGQTITLTFNTEVQNFSFTLYDVDRSQHIDFSATNAANVAQNIDVTTYASSILTINSNNTPSASITANTTSLTSMTDNMGSATITVTSVKTFTITVNTIGSDPVFWLSDINACVTGSFPNNYNQTGNNRPLQGPAGNQPDYFLITPDNDAVYMVDPATGEAWFLFNDPANMYVNSMAYDPYNHILYYVSENFPATATNKKLKKYDFNTNTITTIFTDITTALNIPTFDQSLEGAGAAFYDGALYLGVEGGQYSNSSSRESIVFRIDFDVSLNPVNICQVFATRSYSGSTLIHDWADFVIKNGVLFNFNSAKGTTIVSYEHFNMMTGASSKFMNPGNTNYAGQAGMTWTGELYDFFSNGIAKYNENGTFGSITPIVAITGGPWPGGNGDASENFRPQVDFGDAPATYDPNPVSPAAHAQDVNLRLGAGFSKEWITRGQNLAADDTNDDGLPGGAGIFSPAYGNYLTQVNVFNNTGANATVAAWLDYNGNGLFDASEGITVTVATNTSTQSVYLYWPSAPSSLVNGTYTYLRIRVTYASKGMTTANATGYYSGGEVEDYRVPVNAYPLSVQLYDFNARLTNVRTVKLDWSAKSDDDFLAYAVEKSKNNSEWETVGFEPAKANNSVTYYSITDANPAKGVSWYRLKMIEKNGKMRLSNAKKIDNKIDRFSISISPNPASGKAIVSVISDMQSPGMLQIINKAGSVVFTERINISEGTSSIELPVSRLLPGSYIIRVTTANQSKSQTLILAQ